MLKKNSKRYLIISLVLIEVISLFLTMKSFSNKEIEEKKETYEVDKKHFSMFINDGKGNYEEYNNNVFPNGYAINLDKSRCIDTKGNVINGILSTNGSNVTITSNKTAYCYLYFDEGTAVDIILANGGNDLWKSTLDGDGYRFVGTDPDNYICFGTTNKSTCTGNTDLYMYRIIGIFEDAEGKQHLKLIKKEALNTNFGWHSDTSIDTDWENSVLYKLLKGSYFLTSTIYSYMQDSIWLNKIETWDYIATNTKTYENSGPNYYDSVTVKNIYLHEMNRSSKTSNVGIWETVSGKISLMYVSDYLLSLGSSALDYISSINTSTLKTGWMHISNNDRQVSGYEWTSTRYGGGGGYYGSWLVFSNGRVGYYDVGGVNHSARPVFYLTSDVKISGEGTTTNPYIIG